jgi:uncharacterized protein YjbI with pentapeptide repeats
MIFLGKIYLDAGGKRAGAPRLGVRDDGIMDMLSVSPDDPAGMFLAYDVGGGWFGLQAHTGQWVTFLSLVSENFPWGPVLYNAFVRDFNGFARFDIRYFEMANRRLKLVFRREDNGQLVGLTRGVGENPLCRCPFGVNPSYEHASSFGLGVVTPGLPEIQQTKSGAGGNFRCLGKACIYFSSVTFSQINFQEADFAGANLRSTVFDGCTLIRTKFKGADLTGTDFRPSSLAGADFSDSDLTNGTLLPEPPFSNDATKRTVFRNAKVPASALKNNWSYLDLTGAQLSGLQNDLTGLLARYTLAPDFVLAGLTLSHADFSNSDLTRANFQHARLESAKFQSAILIDCTFSRCKLEGASFAPNPSDPNKASTDLSGARFSFAVLSRASMHQALLLRAVFTSATMDEIDLTSAQLGGVDRSAAASLSYAYLANAKLDKANLFGVNFAFVTLFGASTSVSQTATMEQANFSNAYLAGIDLTAANLRGASFVGACLVNVRLNNAVFLPAASGSVVASLAGATLQGVDFTGAQLNNADLSNAAVAFANGEIPVRYCDEYGHPFPEPPASMPLRFGPTIALDLNTMGPDTKCPNGFTVHENQLARKTLQQMLTSTNAPTTWSPVKCGPAPGASE